MNDYTKPPLGASPAYISAENRISRSNKQSIGRGKKLYGAYYVVGKRNNMAMRNNAKIR